MSESYLKPVTSVKVKLFLRDEYGKPAKFPKRYGVRTENNGYALAIKPSMTHGCREVLIRNVGETLERAIFDQDNHLVNHSISMRSPEGRNGKPLIKDTAEISYKLSHHSDKYRKRLLLLQKKKTEQKKVFDLINALAGGTAVMLGGAGAITPGARNQLRQGNREVSLVYRGLSNFIIKHPAIMSLLLGMGRFALELWADNKYKGVDEAIDVSGILDRISEIVERGKMTAADRKYILGKFRLLQPFFSTDKVSYNPGFYPLNKYNWDAFVTFIGAKVDKASLNDAWAGGDLYGSIGGFHEWCEENVKSKSLRKAFNSHCWAGSETAYDAAEAKRQKLEESAGYSYSW